MRPIRKADTAWLGDLLQACCDVHSIAIEAAGLVGDDIADMEADPQHQPSVGWKLWIALGFGSLHHESTLDRADNA